MARDARQPSEGARGGNRVSHADAALESRTPPMFEIGNSLREARLRQQLDFPELEQQTKIRAKYLKALEAEDFDVLPAPTYVKGFLRNYADALGLEGQLYVDEYNSRFVTGEEDVPLRPRDYQRRPQPLGPRFEARAVLLVVGAIAVVFALVIGAWKWGSGKSPQVQGVNSPTPTVAKKGHKKPARPMARAARPADFQRAARGGPRPPVHEPAVPLPATLVHREQAAEPRREAERS